MDAKILRLLIFIFSGLVAVFALLILVNYAGSLYSSRSAPSGQEEEAAGKPPDPEAMAQQALAAARNSGGGSASMIPPPRHGFSTAAVNSDGAIMVVKEKEFGGVAEQPKDMLDLLTGLGGGRNKPAPIALKESDLDKKLINIGGAPVAQPHLKVSSIPEMGRGAGQEGVTVFTAPVDFKIFKSSETWWAFTNSHKCRSASGAVSGLKPAPSLLSSPDFAKDSVVVLISVSELPNGIFKILKVEKTGKELRLDYRVDPLAMAAGETGQHDFYSTAVIPKAPALKLRQVP